MSDYRILLVRYGEDTVFALAHDVKLSGMLSNNLTYKAKGSFTK